MGRYGGAVGKEATCDTCIHISPRWFKSRQLRFLSSSLLLCLGRQWKVAQAPGGVQNLTPLTWATLTMKKHAHRPGDWEPLLAGARGRVQPRPFLSRSSNAPRKSVLAVPSAVRHVQ